jgi:hypothetical protein
MEKQNDIIEELRSLESPLANLPRAMPFVVPVGYFEEFCEGLKVGISAEAHDHPLMASKAMPFELPDRYFETFPARMTALASASEELLKVNPFTTPAGYFDQLPMHMLQAAKESEKKKPKVIPLTRFARSIRWAAAALLVIALGFGSFRWFTEQESVDVNTALAAIPKEDISKYVEQNIDDFDIERLENTIASTNALQAVSDEDIIRYLDETGWNTTN